MERTAPLDLAEDTGTAPDEIGDGLVELVRPRGSGELIDDVGLVVVRLGGAER